MPGQIGLVVHPRRDISAPLGAIRDWAAEHGVALGQIRIPGQERVVEEPIDGATCEFVIAIGGDGTALAALHVAAAKDLPVLAVACGSIGVLTSVDVHSVDSTLDRVAAGEWTRASLPGLEVSSDGAEAAVAINDVTVARNGTGQVITEIRVNDELYARTAGDGLVVATPLGSSAYTMAAGGPIVLPTAHGMVLTPLAQHGGVSPPLVVGAESRIGLVIEPGYGGGRLELDGQELGAAPPEATVTLRPDYATLITLSDQETILAGLRRRGLVADSPRLLVRDRRAAAPQGA